MKTEKERLLKELRENAQKLDSENKKLMDMLQPIGNPSTGKSPKVWNSSEFKSLTDQENLIMDIIKNMLDIEKQLRATKNA